MHNTSDSARCYNCVIRLFNREPLYYESHSVYSKSRMKKNFLKRDTHKRFIRERNLIKESKQRAHNAQETKADLDCFRSCLQALEFKLDIKWASTQDRHHRLLQQVNGDVNEIKRM